MEEKIFRNSLNYIPVDVAKGIDRITGKRVNADDLDPNYERMPKCMHCKNFRLNEEKIGLGWCHMKDKDFIAYPDMVAVTCKGYMEK
ncbi:MAG: 4-hydroxyphenylacetate decarboxylase small subunit [Bacteroidia bacterium]|nr:4-hydroxyphenylacetate decarboxylase small subunit [Bacteroidales bacterium]NCD42235.1 4-hydroxyphenylacetate decarboxylase small subunit [Bacteroidia bacterium]MDD3012060.1 4-hydroxyphenylacetate decarboxylase small subunit [Bacteroidales bacterium]MDD3961348.1 4-hydroxyphenylacetate decarboxylase small subunit [Bacteroidales bacterium]MDY0286296.1 4-hydroxyphenylacetate decarboxylase small subunit [Bacteroidales bacterium]